jgi:uncharacterized protein (TIGR00725 family)
MRKVVAVIGDSTVSRGSKEYELAFQIGKALIDKGYRIQSGGLGGIMEAVLSGAHSSEHYIDGDTIAIVPSFDRSKANEFADIVIPTGMDMMRNAIVANADAVVAIGGGAGTLSEMAIAWSLYRLIIGFKNVEGWSSRIADQPIDARFRYDFLDDRVFGVESVEEMIHTLQEKIEKYNRVHHGIR